jgi:hypothetical protein
MTGQLQQEILILPNLDNTRYENIFKLYTVEKDKNSSYYYYNILNKVIIPDNIDQSLLGTINLDRKLPWTTLSYKIYNTTYLWWLIVLLNKPKNIFYADAGIQYKYILQPNIDGLMTDIIQQADK